MREMWAAWKRAASLAWNNMTRLIAVNLLWVLVTLPLITVGPATLAAYWWLSRTVRDEEEEGYAAFFRALLRFAVPGLIWSAGWAVVIWLAWANLTVYARMLPPFGIAVVQVAWIYALIYLGAMQPYLLETLTVEEAGWGAALKRSAWQVLANPLYSHLNLLLAAVALWAGTHFSTIVPVVLVALILVFWTVAAADVPWKYGGPPPMRRRVEDVL